MWAELSWVLICHSWDGCFCHATPYIRCSDTDDVDWLPFLSESNIFSSILQKPTHFQGDFRVVIILLNKELDDSWGPSQLGVLPQQLVTWRRRLQTHMSCEVLFNSDASVMRRLVLPPSICWRSNPKQSCWVLSGPCSDRAVALTNSCTVCNQSPSGTGGMNAVVVRPQKMAFHLFSLSAGLTNFCGSWGFWFGFSRRKAGSQNHSCLL